MLHEEEEAGVILSVHFHEHISNSCQSGGNLRTHATHPPVKRDLESLCSKR